MTAGERARKLGRIAFHQAERAAAFLDRWSRKAALAASGASALEREAEHWSGRAGGILTWQDHPVVREQINRRVSGEPGVNWLAWFAREFGAGGFQAALNLGCGRGDLETHAFSLGLIRRFLSVDLAGPALRAARERLRGYPVEYERADANSLVLPAETYDVAFAAGSLHHFERLEHVLDEVWKGLRPGGWLVFDEYVGPSRFQWREEQLLIINELLAVLPARLRRDRRRVYGVKRRVHRAPRDETSRDSPFEAVRSEEILPLTAERFRMVARRDYGGAVLHPLLDGIAGNFRRERPDDVGLLRRLARLEADLEAAGRIGSDFSVVVARKE